MLNIAKRYATSVNSSCLTVDARTTFSDTDCLGAMGLAAREFPLGAALQRLFVDGKAKECASVMAAMAFDRGNRIKGAAMSQAEAQVMAEKVLGWFRFGTCQSCGGTGKEIVIEPKPHLSEFDCQDCHGTGKQLFDRNFRAQQLDVARWLRDQVQKHQAMAGAAAMRKIADQFDL
jgi:hypothetical protein